MYVYACVCVCVSAYNIVIWTIRKQSALPSPDALRFECLLFAILVLPSGFVAMRLLLFLALQAESAAQQKACPETLSIVGGTWFQQLVGIDSLLQEVAKEGRHTNITYQRFLWNAPEGFRHVPTAVTLLKSHEVLYCYTVESTLASMHPHAIQSNDEAEQPLRFHKWIIKESFESKIGRQQLNATDLWLKRNWYIIDTACSGQVEIDCRLWEKSRRHGSYAQLFWCVAVSSAFASLAACQKLRRT